MIVFQILAILGELSILFQILAILGELSILLHNIQPISSLEPLQIVQVSSLFDY